MAKLRQDVDVIGVQTVGADGVRFVKQFQEYGLKGKIPVVDASVGVSEISLLAAAGDAAVGVHNSQPYQYTIDTPRNRRFVQAFRSKFESREVFNRHLSLSRSEAHKGYNAVRGSSKPDHRL